jgi:hypothetical protein
MKKFDAEEGMEISYALGYDGMNAVPKSWSHKKLKIFMFLILRLKK